MFRSVFPAVLLLVASSSFGHPQRPIKREEIEVKKKPSAPRPRGERVAPPRPTTGSIVIGMGQIGVDGSKILIDDQQPDKLKIKANFKKEQNRIELQDVSEGIHTLTLTHPAIVPWIVKVPVEGGDDVTLTPMFEMALVQITVKSEPEATIFFDGGFAGKTLANGELRLPDKKPGQHTITAEKDKFVTDSKTENFAIGEAVVDLRLSRIVSSPEFSDYFQAGTSFWDAPKTWQVRESKLYVVDAPEVGLRNGVYDDFKMVFDISIGIYDQRGVLVSGNEKGAVWVVRARDKKNFYLFQLGGPKGAKPKFIESFVYQNGQAKLLGSDRIAEDLSRQNDSFMITVEAKGPTIKHFIQSKKNPSAGSQLISTLTDNTHSYGSVGFGTLNAEEFIVYSVSVFPEAKTR